MTSQQELDVKLERVRYMLCELSMDAIYLKRQDNFAWLTCGGINYVGLGDIGNCGLLITREAQYAITNNIEAQRMRDEEKLEELGYEIHAQTWFENAFESETLKKLVPSGRIIFDYACGEGVNTAEAVKRLRFSLTQAEIERYREGGYLTARAIEETIAQIRPGDNELKIVGYLAGRIRESGLDIVSAMCAGDERIEKYRHPIPTEHRVRKLVQLGGNMRYKGLIICCTRFISFGTVSPKLAAQYRANVEIDCTFMANSIPGKSFASVLEAGQSAYKSLGLSEEFNKHHQGGPIGYSGRDYRVSFETEGLIQENQAFCWNPSITGTKSEDTVIATSAGILPVSYPVICPSLTVSVENQSFVRPCIWEG